MGAISSTGAFNMKLALSLFMIIFLSYIERSSSETPLLEESYLNQNATEEDVEDRVICEKKHSCTEGISKEIFYIWPRSEKPNQSSACIISDVEKSTRCTTIFKKKGKCKQLVLKCPVFTVPPGRFRLNGKGITNKDKLILETTTGPRFKAVFNGQDLKRLRCRVHCRTNIPGRE